MGEGRARERVRRHTRPGGRRRVREGCRERLHHPRRPHPRARQGHVLQGTGLRRPRGWPAVQRSRPLHRHPPKVSDGAHVSRRRQAVHRGRHVLVRRRRGSHAVLPLRGGRPGLSRALALSVRRSRPNRPHRSFRVDGGHATAEGEGDDTGEEKRRVPRGSVQQRKQVIGYGDDARCGAGQSRRRQRRSAPRDVQAVVRRLLLHTRAQGAPRRGWGLLRRPSVLIRRPTGARPGGGTHRPGASR